MMQRTVQALFLEQTIFLRNTADVLYAYFLVYHIQKYLLRVESYN